MYKVELYRCRSFLPTLEDLFYFYFIFILFSFYSISILSKLIYATTWYPELKIDITLWTCSILRQKTNPSDKQRASLALLTAEFSHKIAHLIRAYDPFMAPSRSWSDCLTFFDKIWLNSCLEIGRDSEGGENQFMMDRIMKKQAELS